MIHDINKIGKTLTRLFIVYQVDHVDQDNLKILRLVIWIRPTAIRIIYLISYKSGYFLIKTGFICLALSSIKQLAREFFYLQSRLAH